MKVSYHCSECNKSWTLVLASPETRNCKTCNRTVYGEKVITRPPPPPPPANKKVNPKAPPRRWETVSRPVPEQPKEDSTVEAESTPAGATEPTPVEPTAEKEATPEQEKVSVESSPADSSQPPAKSVLSSDTQPARRKPRTRPTEQREISIPHPSAVREYIPIDQRPENQRPKPKFYRFFALNSHNAPGIAGAIAESHDEAVERIILRFLQNVVLLSNRNQKIAEIRLKYRPKMQEQSPQEFNRVLREAGITPHQYERMLGPTPPDSLGAWNPQLQHNITEEAANHLKEELMQAPYVEYPIEDCAFYLGPAF